MTEFDLFSWMMENKLAKNGFNAAAIASRLELGKLSDPEEIKSRVLLYREWRLAGEKTRISFEHAIRGDKAPERLVQE